MSTQLARIQSGDLSARGELIQQTCGRLERLARKMLRSFPELKRWEQTDDVLQNALVRLFTALEQVRPETPLHFLNLAALEIRRELLDLNRHHFGPHGPGANHASNADLHSNDVPLYEQADCSNEPSDLLQWREFHERVDALPEKERIVLDLLFYHGLTQPEAAEVLGVTTRTVQNRYKAALVRLRRAMKSESPYT